MSSQTLLFAELAPDPCLNLGITYLTPSEGNDD
jgi:hypothetical protein